MLALVSYSPLETKILNAIPEDGMKVSTLDLVALVYVDDARPRAARQSVLDAACKLIEKVDVNEERFEIFRSKARGPIPIWFWKEPRKRTGFDLEDFFTVHLNAETPGPSR